jgi:hypothetical protein
MTDAAIVFVYHLFWGFALSLAVSLLAAKRVATQATLVQDYTGRAMTTFRVDRAEFLKTWGLYTAAGSAVTVVILLLWETRAWMLNAGYIG